jgi:CPA2 family monovalent cation:H+ antiporter-2
LRAASEALPMRDAFAVLFFISVGMLFNPHHLLEAPGMVAATLAIILLGKPLAALSIVLMLGYPVKIALAVAVALAQIGEFSFILATLGKDLGVLSNAAVNTIVAAAIVSITLNPLLYRLIGPLERWAMQRPRLWRWLNARSQSRLKTPMASSHQSELKLDAQPRAIIVGYGPVGKTVTRLLRASEIEPAIIELNLETVRRLRAEGLAAVYGDASHHETLKSAGIETAGSLILSAAGARATAEIIRVARDLNSKISVLVRANYLREMAALRQAGADHVLTGEGEVALAMTEFILRQLGATPEQIDHERDRIRAELFGAAELAEIAATISTIIDEAAVGQKAEAKKF